MDNTVREVMTGNPTTADSGESVTSVARTMRDGGIDVVVVVSDGNPVGLVSDHDLLSGVLADGADAERLTLGEAVTEDLVVVDVEDGLDVVTRRMREHSVRQAVVMENGVPVGVVDAGDPAVQGRPGRIDAPTPEHARKSDEEIL
ncbi:cyclic nucleotide-binding/CBS domain-containing protein [Streptomyces sp. NPDC059597]|uniref:CBS domain-containing protein n=1 Tax=Streptomyces sp. NPDC059597 TaxID=3346879 RepID=UPI0036A0BC70